MGMATAAFIIRNRYNVGGNREPDNGDNKKPPWFIIGIALLIIAALGFIALYK